MVKESVVNFKTMAAKHRKTCHFGHGFGFSFWFSTTTYVNGCSGTFFLIWKVLTYQIIFLNTEMVANLKKGEWDNQEG